jgi:hypothetical protein
MTVKNNRLLASEECGVCVCVCVCVCVVLRTISEDCRLVVVME